MAQVVEAQLAPARPDTTFGALEFSGVSVVIPTLNEAENISWVLDRLPSFVEQVVVVDGRSTDKTIETVLSVRPDAEIVQETRPGKGVALRAGFEASTGRYIVMMDADGSMNPAEIGRFIVMLEGGFDLVKGSRVVLGSGSEDLTPLRQLGNRGLTDVVNLLYGTRFTDLCYGFMAFHRAHVSTLALRSDGFEIESEILANAISARLKVAEVASIESPRMNGQSNLRTFRDGSRVLRTILTQRFGSDVRRARSALRRGVTVPADLDLARPEVAMSSVSQVDIDPRFDRR